MKKILFLGAALILLLVFQISVFPYLFPSGFSPNLVLIFFIYSTLGKRFSKSFRQAVFFGFISDLTRFYPPGINMASFAAVSFLVSSFSKRFLIFSGSGIFLGYLGIMALASFFNFWLVFSLLNFFQSLSGAVPAGLASFFPESGSFWKVVLSDTLFFALIFWPMEKARRAAELFWRVKIDKTRFLK